MVNFWLWGNLSLENLNLECELEIDNRAFRLYDYSRTSHLRNYAHPRRNFQSPSCRLNRRKFAAGLAICTNQRHRLPMEPNSCCSWGTQDSRRLSMSFRFEVHHLLPSQLTVVYLPSRAVSIQRHLGLSEMTCICG